MRFPTLRELGEPRVGVPVRDRQTARRWQNDGAETGKAGGSMKTTRAATMAAGLVTVASLGLSGAGPSSAATPALHIAAGSKWTAEVNGNGCEVDTFAANGTFRGDHRDRGTWSGGGTTLNMTWTAGYAAGLTFSGTFTKTPVKEYSGTFANGRFSGQVVKGAVPGC
jgi:hypothetical protein